MPKPDWAKKVPRSSRECVVCKHKYSSHIDCKCLKIISRNPREECTCKRFMSEKDLENSEIWKKDNLE
jgi:hypothetical protein